ncbi:MAG: cell envelope biogenesis protein OmpA, partial [Leptolyngbyaceae cyanobacterium SM2_5_2]|nr:cell envelope biogenesis protein OmpA [Leptolyngbyaceae cyanobacterium SM2_5_2]
EPEAPPPVLPAYSLTVNSPLDGPVTADQALTLREAIELANGSLAPEQLSPAEQALVQPGAAGSGSQIGFSLPDGQTTIALVACCQRLRPLAW